MEEESYGVTLELITNKFKKQIENVKSTLKNFRNDVKKDSSVTIEIDKNLNLKQLEKFKQDIKNELSKLSESVEFGRQMGIVDYKEEAKIKRLNKGLEAVENRIKEINDEKVDIEVEKAEKDVNRFTNNVGNNMKKGINNIKKFALSLFTIRSAWAIISKASSAYMAQDQQLSNQIQRTWASLGAMLTPIIEKLVQGLRVVIAYVNYFVKALTGKDLISKATKKINAYNKSLNKTSKSSKGLNKELTSLDEVTNLSFDDASTAGIEDVNAELDDFSDIKLDKGITDTLDKWAKALKDVWKNLKPVRDALKNVIDWAIKNPDVVLKILGGVALLKTLSSLTGGTATGGLLGSLFGSLKNLASIGIITVGVSIIYDSYQKINKASNEHKKTIKNNVKLHESNTKSTQKLIETGEKYQNSIQGIDENIEKYNDTLLKSNKRIGGNLEAVHNQYNWISKLNGSYKDLDKEVYQLVNQEISQTNALKKSYDAGKLTISQASTFKETLKEQIIYYANLAKKTKEGTYENEIYNKRIQSLAGTLKEISKEKYSPKLEVDTTTGEKQKNTFMTNLKKSLKEKFSITISALFNGKAGKSKLNEFFTGVNKFAGSIKNAFGGVFKAVTTPISSLINKFLPSFDVGTNYVPNDMVAQIHKGEMIVPAKYNPMTSGIGGNEETNALLIELNRNILELSKRPNELYVNGQKLAEATYNDFQNEGNRLNQSMTIKRS